MRIVHLVHGLEPGGTEGQCVQLARGLAESGADGAVWYGRAGPLLADLAHAHVPARQVSLGSMWSPRFALELAALARALRGFAPQVVQTYGFYTNVPGMLAAAMAGVPVRVTGRREIGLYLRSSQRRAERWIARVASCIVANSEAGRQQLIRNERVPASKVAVIRNGLNPDIWHVAESPTAIRPSGVVVGMVANFRDQKDHATFVHAATQLVSVVPDVRFCLVGSGPLEPAVRASVANVGLADRFEFVTGLHGPAVWDVVRSFRVSVLASKHNEGVPNALLESMALSVPVVASNVGGIPELITDGVTGFLVPPGDPRALCDRILRLLKDPSLAEDLARRAWRHVDADYRMPRMVAEFAGLYTELLRGEAVTVKTGR